MKKQDKLFDLLKRNGWEQKDTIECEGISIRFKQYEYYKDTAYNDCYHALGRLTALDLADTCQRIYVQKEGPYYAAYIEF